MPTQPAPALPRSVHTAFTQRAHKRREPQWRISIAYSIFDLHSNPYSVPLLGNDSKSRPPAGQHQQKGKSLFSKIEAARKAASTKRTNRVFQKTTNRVFLRKEPPAWTSTQQQHPPDSSHSTTFNTNTSNVSKSPPKVSRALSKECAVASFSHPLIHPCKSAFSHLPIHPPKSAFSHPLTPSS